MNGKIMFAETWTGIQLVYEDDRNEVRARLNEDGTLWLAEYVKPNEFANTKEITLAEFFDEIRKVQNLND